jgi:hypothetical protein
MRGSPKPHRPACWRGTLAACLTWCVIAPVGAAQPNANSAYCDAAGANLVFIIDTTTAYDDQDKELLVRAVGEMFEMLHGGERIVIRTITDTFSTSQRVVERCLPRCASQGMLDSWFNCNEGLIVSETKKAKRAIVEGLRAHLAAATPRARSDIARTLASIAREDARAGGQNLLYVFSDMIENSDHVPGRLFFSAENKRLLAHMKKYGLVAALKGAEVHVFGFGRDGTEARNPLQVGTQQKLLEFWRAYFKAAGANLVEMGQNVVVRR